jgi:hypothetical protein
MTLCAAWIRQAQSSEEQELSILQRMAPVADDGQELVFVTDSRLSGGEAWDSGLKLFDLGRSDSLLCFTGVTRRAYPLILHANNSKRLRNSWSDPRLDLHEVVEAICTVFTDVCGTINDTPKGDEPLTGDDRADFLFGGWSWRQQRFCIWELNYSPNFKAYTANAVHSFKQNAFVVKFIGDNIDRANALLEEELRKSNGTMFNVTLDMEPMRVIANMARDNDRDLYSIGGALQIAKVYKSGHSEFFGIMWPSAVNGKATFLGQKVNPYDAPPIRFLDPDTGEFIGGLPTMFEDLEQYDFGSENDFVQRCYPNKKLKTPLTEVERKRLFRILQEEAYREFKSRREAAAETEVEPLPRQSKEVVSAEVQTAEQEA